MVKHFCDCCGKETTTGSISSRLFKFSHLCHLSEDRRGLLSGHIDTTTMQPISGRDDTKEMCITCYNATVVLAVKAFEERRDSFKKEDTDEQN